MQHKILEVCDISVQFGGIDALDGVSFDMDPGTILGLIGPNGAGKTTLFNCLSRFCSPDSGDIIFQGKSILQMQSKKLEVIDQECAGQDDQPADQGQADERHGHIRIVNVPHHHGHRPPLPAQ